MNGFEKPTDGPRPSPGTDPTNPNRQESLGIFVPNERAAERNNDEEGLTDEKRAARDPSNATK